MGCCSSASVVPDNCPHLRQKISQAIELMKVLKTDRYKFFMTKEGLKFTVSEYQKVINDLQTKLNKLQNDRTLYLEHVCERDADEIRRACKGIGVDKSMIVEIINNRTNEQLKYIDLTYKNKYNMTLTQQMMDELTSATGGFLTGALSDLGEFITNRTLVPPERDARLIMACCKGIGTSDTILIEILASRDKNELTAIKTTFEKLYNKTLSDVLKKEISFPNYSDLANKILWCRREINTNKLSDEQIERYCKIIYDKLNVFISVDGKEINELFTTVITPTVFEQCNLVYGRVNKIGSTLLQHIKDKTGGDYENFLTQLSMDKYKIWSQSLNKSLTSILINKDTINRVLGCLNKRDACILKNTYDKLYPTAPLEATLRSKLSGLYLDNCLHLILSSDIDLAGSSLDHMSPTGNNREEGDEMKEAIINGTNDCLAEQSRYSNDTYITRSEATDHIKRPEKEIPSWDGVGVSMDETALSNLLSQYTTINNKITQENNILLNELEALKATFFNLVGKKTELNTLIKITTSCIKGLTNHISLRDAKDIHLFADTATDLLSNNEVIDNLINVVCERTREQISNASAKFYTLYKKEMSTYVQQQLNNSDFSKFIYYIIASSSTIGPNTEYKIAYPGVIVLDVNNIREATKGFSSWLSGGTNDNMLSEILFCRTNKEINLLKSCWMDCFKYSLEEEILKEIGSNNYGLLYQGCLLGQRDESNNIDRDSANRLCDGIISQGLDTIWKAGITDSICKLFIDTLSLASDAQLQYIATLFKEKNVSGSGNIIDVIQKTFINDKYIMNTITSKFMSREDYLARRLQSSMDSLITDKTTLVRILATSSKSDIIAITASFQAIYFQPFNAALSVALNNNPNLLKAIRAFIFNV